MNKKKEVFIIIIATVLTLEFLYRLGQIQMIPW